MRLAQDEKARELVSESVVPRLTGKASIVATNHIRRVIAVERPQVTDFNAFNKE